MSESEKFYQAEVGETPSQIEPSEAIGALVKEFSAPFKAEDLSKLRDKIFAVLDRRVLSDSNRGEEQAIRWKRTADQILADGYTFKGKDCTDIAVLFMSACRLLGLETSFVKLKKDNTVHSIVEICLPDGWYIFDPSNLQSQPTKGQVTEAEPWKDWRLWKKGRDAWDLGLTDYDSIKKID